MDSELFNFIILKWNTTLKMFLIYKLLFSCISDCHNLMKKLGDLMMGLPLFFKVANFYLLNL